METLEALGSLTALAGSAVLATGGRHAWYGFALYFISNVCWIGYAVQHEIAGLLVMQIGFVVTSVSGMYRWRKGVVHPGASGRSCCRDACCGHRRRA